MDASLTATSFGYVTAKYTLSAEQTELIPGLTYLKDFLTVDEEQALLAEVDNKPWDGENKSRRTQQFGYGFHWRNRHSKALLRLPSPRDRMPQAALTLLTAWGEARPHAGNGVSAVHRQRLCGRTRCLFDENMGKMVEPKVGESWMVYQLSISCCSL